MGGEIEQREERENKNERGREEGGNYMYSNRCTYACVMSSPFGMPC